MSVVNVRSIARRWPVDFTSPSGRLLVLAALQCVLYGVVAVLSLRFEHHTPFEQRPILTVIALLASCFALHLLGLKTALQISDPIRVAKIVFWAAIVFRGILLASPPIQEIDIYRYVWDGAVVYEGVNPYRYSPEQVLYAEIDDPLPDDLRQLVALRNRSLSLTEALGRIHYGEFATVYPPVSEAVYALAAACTPQTASLLHRVVVVKTILILFDLATCLLVMWLLHMTGQHVAWTILYAWSPLVLKETANSGHLDAIAVMLTTAAVCCWIAGLRSPSARTRVLWPMLTGAVLGIAVGAKLYPIVLLPVVTVVLGRRCSIRAAIGCLASCLVVASVVLAPMILTETAPTTWAGGPLLPPSDVRQESAAAMTPVDPTQPARPRRGLVVFLSHWEINDLPFMLLIENLKPEPAAQGAHPSGARLWFVVVPDSLRRALIEPLATRLGRAEDVTAFLAARAVTLAVFAVLLGIWTLRAMLSERPQVWLEMCFLTLAWFWALSPTMNPWYWTWALPLLPFARGRAWYAVSCLVLLYYLRFWMTYHVTDVPVLGTPYRGESFFHFVVVPIEHGVWMAWLLWEWLMRVRGVHG